MVAFKRTYKGRSSVQRRARNVYRSTVRGVKRRYTTKPKGKRRAYNLGAMAADLNRVKRSLNTETKTLKILTHVPVESSEPGMSHFYYKEGVLKCCATQQHPLNYSFPALDRGSHAHKRLGASVKYTHLTIKGKIDILSPRIPADPGLAGHGELLSHAHGTKFTFMLVALKDGSAFDSPLTDSSVELNSFGRYFRSFLDSENLSSIDEVDYPASFLTKRRTQAASNMKILMRRNVYHSGNSEDDPGVGAKSKLFQFKVPLNVVQKYWRDQSSDPFVAADPWVKDDGHQGNQPFSRTGQSSADEQANIAVAQQTNDTTSIKSNSLHLLVFSDHQPLSNTLVNSGDNFLNPAASPLYRVTSISYLNWVDN